MIILRTVNIFEDQTSQKTLMKIFSEFFNTYKITTLMMLKLFTVSQTMR